MSLLGLIATPRMLLLFSRLLRLTARTGRGLARQQVVWLATRPAAAKSADPARRYSSGS
jgi:hypothetical protein